MRNLITIFTLSLIFSCNSSDESDCCTVIDINVSVKYLNSAGENLIDRNDYHESDIKVYHKIDGNWELYHQGNLDYPKGIRVDKHEDGSYLTIFPSTTVNSLGLSETKIEFSSTDFDILRTEIDPSHGNEIVTQAWYNDVLKWDVSQNERKFEVIK